MALRKKKPSREMNLVAQFVHKALNGRLFAHFANPQKGVLLKQLTAP
jgi:hypothetical protein